MPPRACAVPDPSALAILPPGILHAASRSPAKGRCLPLHRFIDPCSTLVLRTMRYLPRNHCSPKSPSRPVVGRFNFGVFDEQQHPPPVVLPPDPIEQPLVVGVAQVPVPQLPCEFLPIGFSSSVHRPALCSCQSVSASLRVAFASRVKPLARLVRVPSTTLRFLERLPLHRYAIPCRRC